MQLCIENVDQAGGCSYGYSCAYTDSISWASPEQPLPMMRDPRVGLRPAVRRRRDAGRAQGAARARIAASSTGSAPSISRLKKDLGAADRARLSDYLDDVREIERRIQKVEAHNSSGEQRELPGAPIGVPDSFSEHVKLMFDLQALAFASDITRVFAFKLGRDASNRVFPESGFKGAFHSASHHQEKDERILDFAKINKYHVSMVPYFLEKLKNTPDGDGNLLDNSLIIYGSPMGDSNVHNHKRVPAVPRRPRRRRAEGQPAHQGGRRHADGERDADRRAHARPRRCRQLRRQHRRARSERRPRRSTDGQGVTEVTRGAGSQELTQSVQRCNVARR